MAFLCGFSREKVTPELGTKLYGYNPFTPCTEIHDDLFVNAAAFSSGETKALLISADNGDMQTELATSLRKECSDITGIPFQNIIITSTHTHCAPNLAGMEGWGDIDREYLENIFRPALLRAVKNAADNMAEAELGVSEGKSDVGINRREYTEDCHTILGQNPWGLYDSAMTVIRVRRRDDKKGIVNLIHYGCHGTACGCSPIVTRDWYGIMIDRIESETETPTVFVNGAIGDVGPRLTNGCTTGDITHVEELGGRAAYDAMHITKSISTYRIPKMKVIHGTLSLPYQEFADLESVRAQKAKFSDPDSLINIEKLEYTHLCDVEKYLTDDNRSDMPNDFKFDENVLIIDDICIIPFPFEMFSEMSIRLRAYSSYKHTLILSCANGYNGYLPSQDQLCRGGYEVGVFRYCSLFSLADNTDDNIVNGTLKIIKNGK